jgi:hypothetical protein
MRRTILIVLLTLGTLGGFGAEALSDSTCHRNSCHSRRG